MPSVHELSAVARDAFVLLKGAVEIRYRDGDVWKPEEGQTEHPLVHRLRAASLESMTTDPPEPEKGMDVELAQRLKDERVVNERFREFIVGLETLCQGAGMPKDIVDGKEVLAWLKGRIG